MAGRSRIATPRRLPERSCVACRTPRPKHDLVRVVRSPQGTVVIDPTGRMPGRGAYLCHNAECWNLAGRKRSLEHALRVALPDDVVAALASGPAMLPIANTTANHRATGADPEPDDHQGGAHGPK